VFLTSGLAFEKELYPYDFQVPSKTNHKVFCEIFNELRNKLDDLDDISTKANSSPYFGG